MLGGDAGGRIESATRASWEVRRRTMARQREVVEENRSTLALSCRARFLWCGSYGHLVWIDAGRTVVVNHGLDRSSGGAIEDVEAGGGALLDET